MDVECTIFIAVACGIACWFVNDGCNGIGGIERITFHIQGYHLKNTNDSSTEQFLIFYYSAEKGCPTKIQYLSSNSN